MPIKVIAGRLGIGVNLAMILGILWKTALVGRFSLPDWDDEGWLPLSKRLIGLVGVVYCSVIILVKWHKLLVKREICIYPLPISIYPGIC